MAKDDDASDISFGVRLPKSLLERIDVHAEARVVSRSFIIRKALTHYLDELDAKYPIPD